MACSIEPATRRPSGLNGSSNGRVWASNALPLVSCTLSSASQNQRSASGSASHSACAEATETRRSLLVPPNRMVIRIIYFRSLVIPGRLVEANPESRAAISRFRVRAKARPGTTSCWNSDPLDFPLQLDSARFLDPLAHRLTQHLDIMGGGISGIDQEIAVHFRHLRAAQPQAAAAGGIDQLPRAVSVRILEGRSAGLLADRLGGLAVVLHFGHARSNRVGRIDLAAKARRGEDDRGVDMAGAIDEFHIGIRENL